MKKLNFTKKILLILVLAISAIFINSYALIANLHARAITQFAQSNYDSSSRSLEIKNGKFTSHTTSSKGNPDKVDNWEITEDSSPTAVQGIINVDNTTFKEAEYQGISNPEKPMGIEDNYVLAMAAVTGKTERCGYKSTTITLESDKFYAVRVFCKTMNGGVASIYTPLSNQNSSVEEDNFVGFSTYGIWKEYYFLIATDSFDSSANFYVELRLGTRGTGSGTTSSGSVFFDNVEIIEIASRDYENADVTTGNIRKINLDNDYIESFTNSDFESGLQGYTVTKDNGDAVTIAEVKTSAAIENDSRLKQFGIATGDTDNNVGDKEDNNKLLLANLSDAYVSVKTNGTITIHQHGFYRLSLLYKTSTFENGGLNLTLTNTTALSTNDEVISTEQTSLTSGSQSAYNNYSKAYFYIRGNVFEDCKVELTISLGSENSKVTGWAIIDDIKLQRITSTEYAKGSSSDQLDLSSNVPDTSDFVNGLFNFVTSGNSEITYPATPQDWASSSNLTGSGIIRVNETLFLQDAQKYGYGISTTPGPNRSGDEPIKQGTYSYENVLMVKNETKQNSDVYFTSNTSNSVSLPENSSSSSSIVKISVAVKTMGANSKAFIRVINTSNNVIGGIDYISTDEAYGTTANGWITYSIYIKNGIASNSISLQLGTHGSNGENTYAFFDDVTYSSDASDFDLTSYLKQETEQDKKTYKNSTYIDLYENGFYSHSNSKVENLYVQNSMLAHQVEEKTSQYNGILDATTTPNFKVRKDATDNNVLAIVNQTESCQVLKTLDTYSLSQGSYYEFSVWIKTVGLNGSNEDGFGAHFEVRNVDDEGKVLDDDKNKNKFANIVITDSDDNGWVKYSIFVLAKSSESVKVLLGLGYGENSTSGAVYFDDLKVTSVTENEYMEASNNAGSTTIVSKVIEVATTSDDDSSSNTGTTDETSGTGTDVIIWALIPSILLVIALFLAIGGYVIRRLPKQQIVKKIKANEYGMSPYAVDENEIKRELNLAREEKVASLNAQIEKLTKEKSELEAKFEEELKQNENDPERNKLYAKHTKEINQYNNRISTLQSALAYVTDLANIKNEETRTIKERKEQAKEEFIKLKQEELEKEELARLKQEELAANPKKKKYRNVSSK